MEQSPSTPLLPGLIDFKMLVQEFPPDLRDAIVAFTAGRRRREQLVIARPGTAAAIASGYGTDKQRERACRLIDDGAPLAEIHAVLGIPAYFAKLPPRAFRQPVRHVPGNSLFNEALAHSVPCDASRAADWLAHVQIADLYGDAKFVKWTARFSAFDANDTSLDEWRLLAAFAWFSARPELPAAKCIPRRWSPNMSLANAVQCMGGFVRGIMRDVRLGGTGFSDCWVPGGRTRLFRFAPITTAERLDQAATELKNCARIYDIPLALDTSRLFTIHDARQGDALIGMLELKLDRSELHGVMVNEWRLYRSGYRTVTVEAHILRWLAESPARPGVALMAGNDPDWEVARLERQLGPYIAAKRAGDWLDPSRPKACLQTLRRASLGFRWTDRFASDDSGPARRWYEEVHRRIRPDVFLSFAAERVRGGENQTQERRHAAS